MAILPVSTYATIREFVDLLETHEIKPCITLVRHGIIPLPFDTELWSKIPHTLFNKLFSSYDDFSVNFSEIGGQFFQVSTNPLISSSIISFCLSKVPTAQEIENSFLVSISKEVQVMESDARPPAINWRVFFRPIPGECFVTPHQRTDCTPFAMRINSQFRRFRDSIRYNRIWPHGTTRGISSAAQSSLERLRCIEETRWMTPADWSNNISSLSVVKHYIRNGTFQKAHANSNRNGIHPDSFQGPILLKAVMQSESPAIFGISSTILQTPISQLNDMQE